MADETENRMDLYFIFKDYTESKFTANSWNGR